MSRKKTTPHELPSEPVAVDLVEPATEPAAELVAEATAYVLSEGRLTVRSPQLGGVTVTYAAGETVPASAYALATAAERKRLKPKR